MVVSFRALGSGSVDYTPGRSIIHFGTPPEVAKKQLEMDRLRSRGFLFSIEQSTEEASS